MQNEDVFNVQQMQATRFTLRRRDVQILAFTLAQKLGTKHRFFVARVRNN
jgi:hypothetical protein